MFLDWSTLDGRLSQNLYILDIIDADVWVRKRLVYVYMPSFVRNPLVERVPKSNPITSTYAGAILSRYEANNAAISDVASVQV